MYLKHLPCTNQLFVGLKNLSLPFLFFFMMGGSLRSSAQYVEIPDSNFRSYLELNYPACMSGGQLDTTCSGITTITYLAVNGLGIHDLTGIQYFDNLFILYCNNNELTTLPPLPHSLEHLNCMDNLITSLPPLPDLSGLSCYNNLITTLPELPASLDSLYCSFNLLTALPPIIGDLRYIYCDHNNITVLPYLPPNLTYINASYNQISFITPFDSQVFGSLYVVISNNPVACLPPLPDSIDLTFCNTEITCLPNIPAEAALENCTVLPDTCPEGSDCTFKNISGYAFIDADNDCEFDSTEQPLSNRIIVVNGGQFYLNTNEDGYYFLYNLPAGSYELSQAITYPALFEIPCFGNSHTVDIISSTDSFSNVNFPNHVLNYCALNTVDIATPFQRYCAGDNTYYISYCNRGTDTSSNTFIDIQFDPEIIPLSSTLPWSSVNGSTYTFEIGTLNPEQSGSFTITDSVSCDAILNQTASVKANIYPDSSCLPLNPLWDKSSVTVDGYCNATNDTLVFTLKNASADSMTHFSLVTIYEDDLLLKVDSVELDGGDSTIFLIPATGKTYRVEAEQSPFHPGISQPRSFLELCGPFPYSLNKIVPIPQDDADDWVEIDCHIIVSSFDPNDKTSQPSGVGPNHYITANDELDYIINFQNTGNDTAFQVKIIDTLDAVHLDVTTIQPGPGSHPYTFTLDGPGVAKFTFSNILLPDSGTNETASHGFVKYKIRQKAGNAEGTVIKNLADIYFDYNDPVTTNTAFVIIEAKEYIFTAVPDPVTYNDRYEVNAWPNPFDDVIYFEVNSDDAVKNYSMELYNVMGENIYQTPVSQSRLITIRRGEIPPGIYFYKILSDHLVIAAGKLIAK